MSILHVAPERTLRPRFSAVAGVDYTAGEIDPEPGDVRLDLMRLPFGDEQFDAIICNHVLEHVPDDRAAMREVHRVLRLGGWASLLVPVRDIDVTLEDPSITDPLDRERLFEQWDHVRMYGRDYVERLSSAGLVPEVMAVDEIASQAQQRQMKLAGVEPLFIARKPRN